MSKIYTGEHIVLGKLDLYIQKTVSYTNPTQAIKCLNVRPETLKLFEEDIEETFQDTCTSSNLLNKMPVAQKTKARINGITSN